MDVVEIYNYIRNLTESFANLLMVEIAMANTVG